jgi:hypothetical protein
LNRAIRAYAAAQQPPPTWRLDDAEWEQLAELEAVMEVCAQATTLVQTEQYAMAALDWLIKQAVLDGLRADHLMVVNLLTVSDKSEVPRDRRSVEELSSVGKTALFRAKLEMERRYCGNDADQLNNEPVVISLRAQMASFLDPRVSEKLKQRIPLDGKKSLMEELKKQYISFGLQFAKHNNGGVLPELDGGERGGAAAGWGWDNVNGDLDSMDLDSAEPEENDTTRNERLQQAHTSRLTQEFTAVAPRWAQHAGQYTTAAQWRAAFPDCMPATVQVVDAVKHLRTLDLLPWYTTAAATGRYGHLPLMATHSCCAVGLLASTSFCERINSQAKIVLNKKNTKLDGDMMNMVTTLRMNRELVAFLSDRYAEVDVKEVVASLENDAFYGPMF